LALIVTLAMAAFAVLFGTRQAECDGASARLMLRLPPNPFIKLVAFNRRRRIRPVLDVYTA